MAYKDFDGTEINSGLAADSNTIQAGDSPIDLPDNSFIRDANITRDGMDLTLDGPQGTITIEGYFAVETAPDLVAPDGQTLTPELVESFSTSQAVYASTSSMADESPVGEVSEITGDATITRLDGSVEPITQGTDIFQGDIVETGAEGAVNIVFSDETSFAVSEDARLAIDEYVYDPVTQEGSQDFSVLKGVFVFTSGLIGREDPDDVNIDTPTGSIGIRGTIIAGDVNAGEITVVEGAIVVKDFAGNEITLDNQFETAKFNAGGGVENVGQMSAGDVAAKFSGVSAVAPTLFSSINDAAAEGQNADAPANEAGPDQAPEQPADQAAQDGEGENFDADGTVDGDGDAAVDGTVDGAADGEGQGEGGEMLAPEGNLGPDGQPTGSNGPALGQAPGQGPAPMMDASMGMMGNDMGLDGGPMDMGGDDAPKMGEIDANGDMDMVDADGGAENVADGSAANGEPGDGPLGDGPLGDGPLGNDPNPPGGAAGDGTGDNLGDTLQDPGTIGPPPPPTGGQTAPLHLMTAASNGVIDPGQINIAPDVLGGPNFFAAGNGQQWDYHFDLEFANLNDPSANVLDFELSANTVANLDILQTATELVSWNFDTSNGHLTLDWATGATAQTIQIEIRAFDPATGLYNNSNTDPNGFVTYDYEVFNDATIGLPTVIDGSGLIEVGGGAGDTAILGSAAVSTNNTVIAGDGVDAITVGMAGGFIVNHNTINLGDGDNIVTINNSAQNNEIIGGHDDDTFTIKNAQNELWGMDGDDVFEIDLSDTAIQSVLTSAAGNVLIDAGHSSFDMGDLLANNASLQGNGLNYQHGGDTGGVGDTLSLVGGGGSLDFTTIDDGYIRGIERIDALGGVNATITLTYQDIIEMTDYKNTLIINVDAGDTVNYLGGGLTKVGDDITLSDGYTGTSGVYDVYSDGNVTLLVEDNAGSQATVTGLP